MKNLKKPAFILGIVSAFLLLLGIGINANNDPLGIIILYIGAALAGIFWIWAIVEVIGAADLKPFQKRFWLIVVLAVPVVGGLVYHVLHQDSGKIVT